MYIRQSAMDVLVGSVMFIVRPDGVRVASGNGIFQKSVTKDFFLQMKRCFASMQEFCREVSLNKKAFLN